MSAARTAAVVALTVATLAFATRAPAAAAEPNATWVALGDSYTAGIIAGDVTSTDGCLRTSAAYPVLAHGAARPDLELRNVSCASAKTENVWVSQTPPGASGAVPPQLDALGPETQVVTIGMGGNSIGFASVMLTCLAAGPSDPGGTPCTDRYGADVETGLIGSLESQLDQVATEYAEMLADVHRAAPEARVVTVGYPQIVPRDPSSCSYGNLQQFGTVALGDLPFFRLVEERLNERVRAMTEASGDRFVDTYAVSEGHDVCADPAVRFVEGLALSDGTLVYVHPNSRGHAAEAPLVASAVTG